MSTDEAFVRHHFPAAVAWRHPAPRTWYIKKACYKPAWEPDWYSEERAWAKAAKDTQTWLWEKALSL